MPHKDTGVKKAYEKKYFEEHKEERKEYYQKNKEKLNNYAKARYRAMKELIGDQKIKVENSEKSQEG
jgi:hypothetical protein